eukprot:1155148-Pelagomonas_calceolata.AAC.5
MAMMAQWHASSFPPLSAAAAVPAAHAPTASTVPPSAGAIPATPTKRSIRAEHRRSREERTSSKRRPRQPSLRARNSAGNLTWGPPRRRGTFGGLASTTPYKVFIKCSERLSAPTTLKPLKIIYAVLLHQTPDHNKHDNSKFMVRAIFGQVWLQASGFPLSYPFRGI